MRAFLRRFDCVAIDSHIAGAAVTLRRSRRLKLPDGIIHASAQVAGALLVTRNTKDFPEDDPHVRVPYRIQD